MRRRDRGSNAVKEGVVVAAKQGAKQVTKNLAKQGAKQGGKAIAKVYRFRYFNFS